MSIAAATAAPADQPTRYPALRASHRAVRSAVSVGISATTSGTAGSYSAGGLRGRGEVLEPLEPVIRRIGLHADQGDRRVPLLQVTTGAHHGSRRPHGGDEMGNPAAGLGPELGTGRLPVRLRVGRVAVLVGVEVALGLGVGQLARPARRRPRCLPSDRSSRPRRRRPRAGRGARGSRSPAGRWSRRCPPPRRASRRRCRCCRWTRRAAAGRGPGRAGWASRRMLAPPGPSRCRRD